MERNREIARTGRTPNCEESRNLSGLAHVGKAFRDDSARKRVSVSQGIPSPWLGPPFGPRLEPASQLNRLPNGTSEGTLVRPMGRIARLLREADGPAIPRNLDDSSPSNRFSRIFSSTRSTVVFASPSRSSCSARCQTPASLAPKRGRSVPVPKRCRCRNSDRGHRAHICC